MAKAARLEIVNDGQDAAYLVMATVAVFNSSGAPVLASCNLVDGVMGSYGAASVTVPGPVGSTGVAQVTLLGWTVIMSGDASVITVVCTQPVSVATLVATRAGMFNVQ